MRHFKDDFYFQERVKSYRAKSGTYSGCFNTGITFWPKTASLKVLWEKTCCHDAKSTFPVKDVIFLD
jgi:hypothetical protein